MRPTRPPGCRSVRHATRTAAILLACAVLAPTPIGCSARGTPSPTATAAAPRAPGELQIRLRFGAAADLDLYVTGPQLETVYFANTPSRIGGALDRDVRCGESAGTRVETVRFPDAPPGRYRIGVDFPERCSLAIGSVAYAVSVAGDGLEREHAGEIGFGSFEPRALEFDYVPSR